MCVCQKMHGQLHKPEQQALYTVFANANKAACTTSEALWPGCKQPSDIDLNSDDELPINLRFWMPHVVRAVQMLHSYTVADPRTTVALENATIACGAAGGSNESSCWMNKSSYV
jgi:hypothetical protein